MAESDFLSYNSIYNRFSKGPKRVYYALGDEMLPGAILNIPQEDEDDEWGRTLTISLERAYDFIGRIYKTLFDPYNSIPSVSLVPGEAGSELNVAKNMIRLIGRPGIESGVFDLSVPKLTLGAVEINGNTNKLSIGSGVQIAENLLSFSSIFNISNTLNKGSISFKNVTINLNDNGTVKNLEIDVDGKKYTFTKDGLDIGTGLNIYVSGSQLLDSSGNLITRNIYPLSGYNYNIGSETLRYEHLYINKITTMYLCSTYIEPYLFNYLRIGKADYSSNIEIHANRLLIKGADGVSFSYQSSPKEISIGISSYKFSLNGSDNSFSGNNFTFSAERITFQDNTPSHDELFSMVASSPFMYINRTLMPKTPSTVALGDPVSRFSSVYTNFVNATLGGVFEGPISTKNILPMVSGCEIGSDTQIYSKIYSRYLFNIRAVGGNESVYVCGGEAIHLRVDLGNVLSAYSDEIIVRAEMITRSLRPSSPYYTLGTVCGAYYGIYLRDTQTGGIRFLSVRNGNLEIV